MALAGELMDDINKDPDLVPRSKKKKKKTIPRVSYHKTAGPAPGLRKSPT